MQTEQEPSTILKFNHRCSKAIKRFSRRRKWTLYAMDRPEEGQFCMWSVNKVIKI